MGETTRLRVVGVRRDLLSVLGERPLDAEEGEEHDAQLRDGRHHQRDRDRGLPLRALGDAHLPCE